jgi:hypothetical protein
VLCIVKEKKSNAIPVTGHKTLWPHSARTKPTERLPLVSEVSPNFLLIDRILGFLDRVTGHGGLNSSMKWEEVELCKQNGGNSVRL